MVAFSYWDRGMFSVLGRGAAVGVAFRKIRLKGPLAWFAWLFIHLVFLIGFRSKLEVMLNWGYAYLTSGRAIRLITESPEVRKEERKREDELEPEVCPDGPDRARDTEADAHP